MRIKYFTLILALIAALTWLPVQVAAQQFLLSNTTLNGAITSTATTLVLTSASASSGSSFGAPAAGQCLFVDRELMRITAIASTTVTVQRGQTGRGAHATLAVIWTGNCNAFQRIDPNMGVGNQTCNVQPAPWINVDNGNLFWCNIFTNSWRGSNAMPFAYNSVPLAQ